MNFLQNPALPAFALCSGILLIKMIVIGHLTGVYRFKNKSLASPEDYPAFRLEETGGPVDPDVARCTRAHHNDVESTLPFIAIGMAYLATSPDPGFAKMLFIWFTACRLLFSVFYLMRLQPWRSLSFLAGEIAVLIMVGRMLWWGFSNWA